jgi:hypothetical protein
LRWLGPEGRDRGISPSHPEPPSLQLSFPPSHRLCRLYRLVKIGPRHTTKRLARNSGYDSRHDGRHNSGHNGVPNCAEIDAANTMELRANVQTILSIIYDTWPKNTSDTYQPKQDKFKAFGIQKQYRDNDTITKDKLLLFLVEDVANRLLRIKGHKADSKTLQGTTQLTCVTVARYREGG